MPALNTHHAVRVGGRGYASVVLGMGPVAYWRMDGDATDAVGAHDASNVGSPEHSADQPLGRDNGRSLSVSSGNFIQAANHTDLDADALTDLSLSLWIKWTNPLDANRAIVRKRSTIFGLSTGWVLGTTPTGLLFQISDGANNPAVIISGDPSGGGVWRHVFCGIDRTAGVGRIFIGGALAGQSTMSVGSGANSEPLQVGGMGVPGLVDEVAIFRAAPTLAAAQTLYLAGINGS